MVTHPVAWPDEPWVDLENAAKDAFEVNDAIAVFSTWSPQEEDGNDFRLLSDGCIAERRAARLLGNIPEGSFNLRLAKKGSRRLVEDTMDPIKEEARKQQEIVTITTVTIPGALTGIDRVYYELPCDSSCVRVMANQRT